MVVGGGEVSDDETRVVEDARWLLTGVEGVVVAAGQATPRPIQIPIHDGGPLLTVVPTRMHGTYSLVDGVWTCSAVTAIGISTEPSSRPDIRLSVSYTWTDVEAGLRALPVYVRPFIRRAAPHV